MTNDRIEQFYFLKDSSVDAIIFMHNYLQVELSTATLTCYPGPVVLGAAADFAIKHPDYKNQLCALLKQRVKTITETPKGLVLTFADRELLFVIDGLREVLVVTDSNGEWYSYPNLGAKAEE